MLKNCRKNYKGFTLLELLVVVLIIGILAGIALPQYQMAVMKSRYSTMMDIVNAINDAEERYYLIQGKYAAKFDGLDVELSGCTLSDNNRQCNYDWGYCAIALNFRVHCENTKNLKNGYVQYLKFGLSRDYGRSCWAFTGDSNDKYNKLCKAMGAKYYTSGTCTADYCNIYKF